MQNQLSYEWYKTPRPVRMTVYHHRMSVYTPVPHYKMNFGVLAGDMRKAFLQIRVKEAERDALRFH